jgi:regulator of sigma E protease
VAIINNYIPCSSAYWYTKLTILQSSVAIFKTFGSLFTSSEARESVGGIVAIGFVSTDVLKNFGINKFLRLWGMISVNLAIINLFPFPGLDGWQLLVLAVEGITKKEIPAKVKNIVSFIGIILLFGLMFLLVVKDISIFMI